MKYKISSILRYILQCTILIVFPFLIFNLSYPLGSEGPILQSVSRLDPWALLSHLRWQRDIPYWIGLPLVMIVATVLFGRVFCGWLCPLGALLMLVDKLGRIILKNMAVARVIMLDTLHPFRYYWLIFLTTVFILGSNWVFFLTPFALFSHEIVRILQDSVPWLLIGIIAGTLFFSRVWCSVLCPTGVLLSLIARIRLFRYQVSGNCVHCGKCTEICSSGSAPMDHGLSAEWCLTCGSCQKVCPTKAISWRWISMKGSDRRITTNDDIAATTVRPSRRRFFKIAFTVAAATALWKKTIFATEKFLRPPGALSETEFAAACNRCGRCIEICPSKALWPMTVTHGLANFETPHLIPRQARCDLCLVCQEVCPTGAIAQVPLEQVRIGKSIIDKKRCLAWNESKLCLVCVEQCPVLAIQGDEHHRPVVLNGKCVGCGTCENACPVEGEAAIRVFPN